MDKYEVVNNVIQTKPQPIDISIIKARLEEAKQNLQQAMDARATANAESDATIAALTTEVDELNKIVLQVEK